MAAVAGFAGLRGELPYAYSVCQDGGDVARAVTAKEAAGWLREVALQLGKRELTGDAMEKPAPTPSVLWKAASAPLRESQGWAWAAWWTPE